MKSSCRRRPVGSTGGFITTIKGESGQNGIVEGINTSWMYYVIRNGEIEPGSFDLGAGDYNVEDGDEIIFYLGAMDALTWTPKTYLPQLNITPSNVTAGQTLTINISAKKYVWPDGLSDLTPEEAQAVGDYTVQAGENTYTSSYGQVTIPNISAGTWDFIITNSCDQGYPDVVTLAKSIVVGPVEDKTVRVRVEGHATSLANETVTVRGTALDALKAAVGEDQLVAPGGFITTIKGESGQVGIVEGINTSWMYYVIRNGEIEPGAFNLGAGSYNVEDGDEIIFYLGAMDALTWAPKTYIPQVSIDSSEIEEGDSVIININARKYDYPLGLTDLTIDEKSQIGEYTLCIGEETYTSSSGVITLYDVQKGTVVFTVSNVSGSGYPDVVTFKGSFLVKEKSSSGGGTPVKPKSISVKIAVIGEDGDILYGPGSVTLYEDDPYGMSALGALDVTGLSWSFHDSFDGFVSEIEGEENRGSSGWQYKVNGSIPNSLAENKILKKGDKVIWWYGSASSKGPDWDDLEDGNINSSKDDEVLEEKEEEIEGMPAEQVRKTFPDLGQNWDWAKDAIEILAGQGIIEGTGSGFEPGRHITRAEFIKLLVKALQLDLQLDIEDYQENLFQDVKSGDWFAQAVACAQKNGIIEGDPDRRFRPHDKISRNEIAAILYRLLETTIPTLEMNSLPFSDVEKVPAWAANGVKYAFQAGLMQGYQDQTFRGGNALNRAEAAVVIYRYLQEISN
ncbi:MAG: S-layer homology domain-containing protein [Bacillota bacterium]